MIAPRVPVTVLTGFLGAGKTTLVRSLLEQAGGRRIAVVVNEFGDIGFDGTLIEDRADPACRGNIVELTNGCICCTVAEDFIPTMDSLLARDPPLDAIVIETSGLALPQPLLKAFDWPAIRTRATIDAVVTVVDATALSEGRIVLDTHEDPAREDPAREHDDPVEEVFEDQLACADLVVLSKADLVTAEALAAFERHLAGQVRPGTRILASHRGELPPEVMIGLARAAEDDLSARAGHHGAEEAHDHDDFESFVVRLPPARDVESVRIAVAAALAAAGVLRVKGHVAVAGKAAPLVVQAVGSRVDLAFGRPGATPANGLVVIGLKGLDRVAIEAALTRDRGAAAA